MTATSPTFAAAWRALPESSPVARHGLIAHLRDAGVDEDQLADIALVVSEGISNVINHAYNGAPEPGEFRLSAELGTDDLRVELEDDGSGMLPRPDTPGLGLGLPLIASLSERFDVHTRPAGGTCLRVWFRVRRSGLPEK
jgi:serine/threonine-protein kinase RsbW/stage II sporulation protein AB (anti-sigma F factor)